MSHPSHSTHTTMPSPKHLQLVNKWSLVLREHFGEPLLLDLTKLDETYLRELASIDPADFINPTHQLVALNISSAAASIIEKILDSPKPSKLTHPTLPTSNPNN